MKSKSRKRYIEFKKMLMKDPKVILDSYRERWTDEEIAGIILYYENRLKAKFKV